MTRTAHLRLWLTLLALGTVGDGCSRPSAESHADAAARTACNQHADAVYDQHNPGAAYRQDNYVSSTRDAPFSGGPATAGPSAGLSDLYQRQTLVADCLRDGAAPVSLEAQP